MPVPGGMMQGNTGGGMMPGQGMGVVMSTMGGMQSNINMTGIVYCVKYEGSKGMKQWPINLCTHDDTQNYPFCRLKLSVKTFEHSTQILKS